MEGLAELGEGLGLVGEEEGVVVHVEGQGQAVGLEGSGEEVEVGQERFGGIEAGAGVVTGGVVQQIEQDLFIGGSRQPGVRAGVVLPEGAPVADLPAFDGLGRLFVTGVRSQLVLDGPAADTGPVGLEVEATEQFTGAGTVGGGRLGRQKRGQLGGNFRRPVGVVVASGGAGSPELGVALGASS